MKYVCLHSQEFEKSGYRLVSLRHQDIMDIKRWRNDQVHILRQHTLLTDDMQELYYRTVIEPSYTEKEPKQILLSFLQDEKCIGYGGLVHIDWPSRRGEVSFLLETKRSNDRDQYHDLFTLFLELIKQVAFQDLKFHRIYTETFDIRPLHVSILEEQGFAYEGRRKDHVLLDGRFIDSLLHGCVRDDYVE